MTRLIIARHAETIWHAERRYTGSSDVSLTERGELQAHTLGEWARCAALDSIWSSDLVRARVTAHACEVSTGLPVVVDERLRELDFGVGEGLSLAEIAESNPRDARNFVDDPAAFNFPEGEDPRSAASRFVACLRDIALAYPSGRILIVAHGTISRLALCSLVGVPMSDYRRLFPVMMNCGLTELEFDEGSASMITFNAPPVWLDGESGYERRAAPR